MATAMTQTDANKGGISLVSTTLSGTTQDIKGFNIGGITISVATGGTPNSELTAAKGSLHIDLTAPNLYMNTDASDGWELVGLQS